MSNKKQSSIEWLKSKIMIWEKDHEKWVDMPISELNSYLLEAEQIHKQEIENAWWSGHDEGTSSNKIYPSEDCNGCYNETFGDNEPESKESEPKYKFKEGDKVKIISCNHLLNSEILGMEYKITRVAGECMPYLVGGHWFDENQLVKI